MVGLHIRSERRKRSKADNGKWRIDGHGVASRSAPANPKLRYKIARKDLGGRTTPVQNPAAPIGAPESPK